MWALGQAGDTSELNKLAQEGPWALKSRVTGSQAQQGLDSSWGCSSEVWMGGALPASQ